MNKVFVVVIVDRSYGGEPELHWVCGLQAALVVARESHEPVSDDGGSVAIHWFEPSTGKKGYVSNWLSGEPTFTETNEVPRYVEGV